MLTIGACILACGVALAAQPHVPGQIIVKFTSAMQHPDSTFDRSLRRSNLPPIRRGPLQMLNPSPLIPDARVQARAESVYRSLELHLWYIAHVDSAADIPALASILRRSRSIANAEPNYLIRSSRTWPSSLHGPQR